MATSSYCHQDPIGQARTVVKTQYQGQQPEKTKEKRFEHLATQSVRLRPTRTHSPQNVPYPKEKRSPLLVVSVDNLLLFQSLSF